MKHKINRDFWLTLAGMVIILMVFVGSSIIENIWGDKMREEWTLIVKNEDGEITKLYRIDGTLKDVFRAVELLQKSYEESESGWLSSECRKNYFFRKYYNASYEATSEKLETISIKGMYIFAFLYENTVTRLRYEREKRIIEKDGMNIYDYVWSEGKRLALSNEHLLDVRLIEKEV